MSLLWSCALLLGAIVLTVHAQDPDEHRNVTQLITAYGYPAENHNVTTPDGYILQIQRIPYGRAGPPPPGSPHKVIYLQHGLLDTACTWVLSQLGSFAFMLADAGFDVWLGNARGNVYCQNHVSLNVSDPAFWAFSWDQFSIYDLPSKISYVLNATGASSLSYVGHSEGTMSAFGLFSNKSSPIPAKINMYIAFAPVAYLHHIGVPLLAGGARIPAPLLWKILGDKGVLESQMEFVKLLPVICTLFGGDCEDAVCYLSGCENKANINQTRLVVNLGHFPAGSSAQNIMHYVQGYYALSSASLCIEMPSPTIYYPYIDNRVDAEDFVMYNYGSATANQQHYGQPTPPAWPLGQLIPPTMIFYGGLDTLADPTDVQTILNTIPTPVHVEFFSDYGHGDFVWGMDAPERLYAPVIQLVNQIVYGINTTNVQ